MNPNEIGPDLQRLMDTHPLLFRGRPPAVDSYVMPGWYGLLDKLCRDIEELLGADGCPAFEIRQIKEKFSSLRFYFRFGEISDLHVDLLSEAGHQHLVAQRPGPADDEELVRQLRDLVNQACAASAFTCEECGAPSAERNMRGYFVTLCDEHLKERQAKR